ncbi:hypothetical protein H4R20_001544 [Coemansia guatemalensis]|uniref:Subtilisin-like protein n=1 Tax=Coemansia guatemalensis TaxID=2761395 RepID=A0A9W8HZ03_9FUNG|nr:hypothetical protein H4R20_001544 [Coemansia guatemalensis]
MWVLISAIFLAVFTASFSSAEWTAGEKVVNYPASVPVKRNSFIIEFHDHIDAHSNGLKVRSMPDIAVDHHYNGLFKGMAVTAGNSVKVSDLAGIDGVRKVYPNRIHKLNTRASKRNITSTYLHQKTGLAKIVKELGLDGKGVKIGIVDSGVDYEHPDLGGCWKTKGCPWQYGEDFIGDKYDLANGSTVVSPNSTPMDCDGHGTHVSGILAATGAQVQGVSPGATYGMYRVLSCTDSSGETATEDAIIIKGMEAAYRDGHDIVSMSIGGGGWAEDPTSVVASKMVANGVIVVAAAGNYGNDGLFTAQSPSIGNGVISVGSVDNWNYTGTPLIVHTNTGLHTIRKAEATTQAGMFIFKKPVSIAAPRDITGNINCCSPIEMDLKGKLALIPRGNCTFSEKAIAAQNAGAAGVILYNEKAGIRTPLIERRVSIPVTMINVKDGELIAMAISAGPVTAMASGEEYKTFDNPNGGKMSDFSSYGPTPELGLVPLLSAPGGDIWSTYPRKKGSYLSLSGTSMSTPYVAGAVALIKQARPELSVDQIRALLVTSSSSITDSKTGMQTNPYRSGAGLVNIYNAVQSRFHIDRPILSINDTKREGVYGVISNGADAKSAFRTLTISNMDTQKGMRIALEHLPAAAITMYNPNHTLSNAVYNQLALPTWPKGREKVPANTIPQGSCSSNCHPYIAPGESAVMKIRIDRPVGLKESERWFYGGFLSFKAEWDDEGTQSTFTVPYAGYNGDLNKINALSHKSEGLPALVYENGKPIDVPSLFKVNSRNAAFVAYKLDTPSRVVSISLVDLEGKRVGYLPGGYYTNSIRTLPSVRGFFMAAVNGSVYPSADASELANVPAGNYSIHLAVLRLLGNLERESDYDIWDSDMFTIE